MQSSAFTASLCASDDQISCLDEISQFDQIIRYSKIGIELVDFALEQTNAMAGTFEAFVRSYDAYIVPHETSKLVPIVGYDDLFVGVRNTTFIPWRKTGRKRPV